MVVDITIATARYHDHGFVFAYIRDFEGMDSGNVTANVVEGKVNKVNVVYVDDNGNPSKSGGETPMEVVERELPFQVSLYRLHVQHIGAHITLLRCSCFACTAQVRVIRCYTLLPCIGMPMFTGLCVDFWLPMLVDSSIGPMQCTSVFLCVPIVGKPVSAPLLSQAQDCNYCV